MGRIRTTLTLAELGATDLVIEAATERETVKQAIFADLLPHLPPAARTLWLQGPDARGVVNFRARDGHVAASGTVAHLKTPAGRAVMTVWRDIALPGMPPLATGATPVPHDAGSDIFASFGPRQVLVRDRASRPKRRKKSPWHIRLWRWLTRS